MDVPINNLNVEEFESLTSTKLLGLTFIEDLTWTLYIILFIDVEEVLRLFYLILLRFHISGLTNSRICM